MDPCDAAEAGAWVRTGSKDVKNSFSAERNIQQTPHKKSIGATVQLCSRYYCLIVFLAILYFGYGLQRAWCALGIPYDCKAERTSLAVFQDLAKVALYGGAVAWFCRLTEPRRYMWLLNWQRWYIWAVYVTLPPILSAISNADFAKQSLATLSNWGPGLIAAASIALTLALVALLLHLSLAKRTHGWGYCVTYLLARMAVYGYFGIWAGVVLGTGEASMHLHHLYLGLAIAIWAEFNHWLSGLTLATGLAVFIQGAGTYTVEPIFTSTQCFTTPYKAAMSCTFWSKEEEPAFSLQVCSAGGGRLPQGLCKE